MDESVHFSCMDVGEYDAGLSLEPVSVLKLFARDNPDALI